MTDADHEREERWLLAVAAGDRGEPLVALYGALAGQVHRIGLRALGDAGAAEELVQETFLRLWRSAERFDPTLGSARTFTFTIARRAAIDQARRARARPHLAGDDEAAMSEIASGEDDVAERIAREFAVRDAIDTLGDKHREVIVMSFDDDLSDTQIAERLAIPVGTVRSRTFYALRALRDALTQRGVHA